MFVCFHVWIGEGCGCLGSRETRRLYFVVPTIYIYNWERVKEVPSEKFWKLVSTSMEHDRYQSGSTTSSDWTLGLHPTSQNPMVPKSLWRGVSCEARGNLQLIVESWRRSRSNFCLLTKKRKQPQGVEECSFQGRNWWPRIQCLLKQEYRP